MFLTLLVFLLVLSVLVFVHELGHFVVAKKSGIKVEEFGFGLPPRIWGKKIGETLYSLNALPIGGFVRLYGEDLADEHGLEHGKTLKNAFWNKPKKVRAAVTVAGVLMNFLLAIVVFSFIYAKLGIPTPTDRVKVVGIVSDSPAQTAGLRENDIILAVSGEPIGDTQKFIELAQKYAGKEINLEVSREGKNMVIALTPRENPPQGEGPLGIAISNMEIKFYPFWQMPVRGAIEGVKESLAWTALIVGGLGMMLYQLITAGTVPQDVAGPVGIFQLTGQVAKIGVWSVLQFIGILSINLAVINILPLPALDGGRLLFIGIEALTRRRVSPKIEAYAHQVGMILLILLILLITLNDFSRIFKTTNLGGLIRGLFP